MGEILLERYSHAWPQRFPELARTIGHALDGLSVRFEHVGSTAVPGLVAKPIIDIDAVIPDWGMLAVVARRLAVLGYVHEGTLGVPDREAFATPSSAIVAHHLYVCVEGSGELERHLAFRDHLRMHPDIAAAYGDLKLGLARDSDGDRARYTRGKSAFVEQVLADARRPCAR